MDDGTHADWTLEPSEPAAWDDESETDWVLEPDLDDEIESFVDEEDDVEAFIEDDAGIVWEEDKRPDEMALDSPDEMVIEDENNITFDDYDEGVGATPEVELAGRRDVSPRAPRPIPSPRIDNTRAPKSRRAPPQQAQEPGQKQINKQRKPRQQQTGRQPLAQWDVPDRPVERADAPALSRFEPSAGSESTPGSRPRPAEAEPVNRQRSQPPGRGASARGRAEALVIGDAPPQPLPESSGSSGGAAAARRRRQTAQKPRLVVPPSGQRSSSRRKRSGKGLLPLITVILVGITGWVGYQQIDPATIQPTLDRLTSLLPFPASTRTAEDSSFEGQQALENLTAEQALSYLEDRALSPNSATTTAESADPGQAAGPPIPKFKPLANDRRSSPVTAPAVGSDNGGDATQDVSIIEQIIRYINPG